MSLYLIAFYTLKPNSHVKTNNKGWMADPSNLSYDEQVTVARKLKNRDLQSGGVILDLINKKVIRNRFNADKSYDEVVKHFRENYKDYIDPLIASLEAMDSKNSQPVVNTQSETISSI